MSAPLISVLHPTARVKPSKAFPRGWRAAFDSYLEKADHPERIEYVISVHESRWEEFWKSPVSLSQHSGITLQDCKVELSRFPFDRVLVVKNTVRDCVVDQLNVAAKASSGKILMGIMDDLEPPEHWDTLLLKAVPRCIGQELQTYDEMELDLDGEYVFDLTGEPNSHIVYGACTRKRYERQGYVLNPAFESMYADNFQDWEARRDEKQGLCKVIDARHLGFHHRHPIYGTSENDEVYALQNRESAYLQGFATFSKLTQGTRVLAVCLPGETFRHEWVATLFGSLDRLNQAARFIVGNHWCFSSNVYVTRITMAQSVLSTAPRADLVLWVDDDNPVSASQIEMLIQDLDEHPELDGVVGWCWCDNNEEPNTPWMMSCGRQSADLSCKRFTIEDFERASKSGKMLITSDDIAPDAFWSGFPVVLMRGKTLETLGWRAFKPLLIDSVKYEFTSEDTSFFYNAHKAGMKFATDFRVKVQHMKFRAIEPQYVPESERSAALAQRGEVREPSDVTMLPAESPKPVIGSNGKGDPAMDFVEC